jgi:hypothetical protein
MESQPGLLEQMWETLRLKHRRFRTEDHQQSALDSWQKNKYAPNICNPAIGKSPFPLRDTLLDLTSPLVGKENIACYAAGFRRAVSLLSTPVVCHDLVASLCDTLAGFIAWELCYCVC